MSVGNDPVPNALTLMMCTCMYLIPPCLAFVARTNYETIKISRFTVHSHTTCMAKPCVHVTYTLYIQYMYTVYNVVLTVKTLHLLRMHMHVHVHVHVQVHVCVCVGYCDVKRSAFMCIKRRKTLPNKVCVVSAVSEIPCQ